MTRTSKEIMFELRNEIKELRAVSPVPSIAADWLDKVTVDMEEAIKRELVEATTKAATEAVNLTNEKWQRDVRRGNGAAVYAALDSVRIEMLKRLAGIHPQISDMGILELCVDAQHEPVRNCDKFRTVKEAKDAYIEQNGHVFIWDGDASERFERWLMAPAKEGK